MIFTWICSFCRWANDNKNGPCRKCGGQTETKLVNGHWKEVTIKEPKRDMKCENSSIHDLMADISEIRDE
jgi:hypothetical protein